MLRNQILKQDQNASIVFGWGLKDERLMYDTKNSPTLEGPARYMSAMMLHQLNKLNVSRIACGDSFSLALTESGKIYSWGIGQNGCLGLGDTIL